VEADRVQWSDEDPVFSLWILCARACLSLVRDELGAAIAALEGARLLAERTGAVLARAMANSYSIVALGQTGHLERTEELVHELDSFCRPRGLRALLDWATLVFEGAHVAAGRAMRAVEPLRSLASRAEGLLLSNARALHAYALVECGDVEAAVREAERAQEDVEFPLTIANGLRSQALAELRAGRFESALLLAERGLEAAAHGSFPQSASLLRLTRAEALHALGRIDEANAAIRMARTILLEIAAGIEDHELQLSFLNRVRCHARTLLLAQEWLVDDARV
jgi:tetratricopeptide (TPR) repeat protein